MTEVKAPLVFRKEWVEQVEAILDHNKYLANTDTFPRVAAPLLDAKPEAYIPYFVSLGPYHHWTLEKRIAASSSAGDNYEHRNLKMSTGEAYKIQLAATFCRNHHKRLDGLVSTISGMRKQIEDFYDWPISVEGKYLEHFALMMALDSFFLLRFLSEDGMKRLEVSIKCDIIKLENQLPLFVLRDVFDFTKDASGNAESFNGLLQKTYKKLSPFDQFDIANDDTKTQISDQPHLLGCLHEAVSPLVQMKVTEQDNGPKLTLSQRVKYYLELLVAAIFRILRVKHPYQKGQLDILKSYNAAELEKAGIHFKCFSTMSDQIRFDKCSGTLYLPQITVSKVQTEVFFRNMVAFEFNGDPRGESVTLNVGVSAPLADSVKRDVGNSVTLNVGDCSPGGGSVTRYVGLMDCLIDTDEDVRLLRESQVIRRGSLMLTDQSIADMWNSICHPVLTGHLEPDESFNDALKDVLIRKYYVSIVKKVLWEYYLEHLSKPGKGVALFVGILLLAMDCAQTFFSWRDWRNGTSKSSPSK